MNFLKIKFSNNPYFIILYMNCLKRNNFWNLICWRFKDNSNVPKSIHNYHFDLFYWFIILLATLRRIQDLAFKMFFFHRYIEWSNEKYQPCFSFLFEIESKNYRTLVFDEEIHLDILVIPHFSNSLQYLMRKWFHIDTHF